MSYEHFEAKAHPDGAKREKSLRERISDSLGECKELEDIIKYHLDAIIELSNGHYIASTALSAMLINKYKIFNETKAQSLKNRVRQFILTSKGKMGLNYMVNVIIFR